MAENLKISEMPLAESLSGDELIPIVKGGNKAATAEKLKEYVQPDLYPSLQGVNINTVKESGGSIQTNIVKTEKGLGSYNRAYVYDGTREINPSAVNLVTEKALSEYKVKDAGRGLKVDDNGVVSLYTDQNFRGTVKTEANTTVYAPVCTFMSQSAQAVFFDNRTYIYDGTREINPEVNNLVTEKGLATVLGGYKVKDVSTDGLTIDENGVVSLNVSTNSLNANIYYEVSTLKPLLIKALYREGQLKYLLQANMYDASRDISPTALNLVTEKALAKHLAEPNMALFDDMWKIVVGSYGTVDHSHVEEDGTSTPYYLNELWMTYKEALTIYSLGQMRNGLTTAYYLGKNIRTILPRNTSVCLNRVLHFQ